MASKAEGTYTLKKYPGKGGWTYAEIPEISPDKSNPFGWVIVNGFIDEYPLEHFKLMPMGNGKVFLSVNAKIRKKIRKQQGDQVYIKIEAAERDSYIIPKEIHDCLLLESADVQSNFDALTSSQQKAYIDWIYQAKTDETRVQRITQMIKNVEHGKQ